MSASPGFDSRPMHESAQWSIIFCCSDEESSIAGEMLERVFLGGVKSARWNEEVSAANVREKVDNQPISGCKQWSIVPVDGVGWWRSRVVRGSTKCFEDGVIAIKGKGTAMSSNKYNSSRCIVGHYCVCKAFVHSAVHGHDGRDRDDKQYILLRI
jgi:hypothetical protein